MLVGVLLAACGSGAGAGLSNAAVSVPEFVPGSSGIGKPPGAVDVHYTLGAASSVRAELVAVSGTLPAGTDAVLLPGVAQGAGDHVLHFDGVVGTGTTQGTGEVRVVRRVVPPGSYSIHLSAGGATGQADFRVAGSTTEPPSMQNILLYPDTISPNSDAVDDVSQLTFRSSESATLSVDVVAKDGTRATVLAPILKGPGEQNVVVNGQDLLGNLLANGVYTVTLSAQDRQGNRVEADRKLTIQGSGRPDLQVLSVDISPQQIMLGGEVAVTVTVKNVGNVPLRTQGPDPGYTYTTNDSYSSIQGRQYVDKPGLWRVGVDWDGNSGGGPPYRYPYRWGFGHTLQPGEIAVTGGKIQVLKQESKMYFYAGVLQEGIQIFLDRLGRTAVSVSF